MPQILLLAVPPGASESDWRQEVSEWGRAREICLSCGLVGIVGVGVVEHVTSAAKSRVCSPGSLGSELND